MLRFGDRGNELRTPPGLDDLVRRLSRLVELPVPRRIAVRRVEDRPLEEGFGHCAHSVPVRAADEEHRSDPHRGAVTHGPARLATICIDYDRPTRLHRHPSFRPLTPIG